VSSPSGSSPPQNNYPIPTDLVTELFYCFSKSLPSYNISTFIPLIDYNIPTILTGNYRLSGRKDINSPSDKPKAYNCFKAFTFNTKDSKPYWQLSNTDFPNNDPTKFSSSFKYNEGYNVVELNFPRPLFIVGYSIKRLSDNNPKSWKIMKSTYGDVLDFQEISSLKNGNNYYKLSKPSITDSIQFVYLTSFGKYPKLGGLQFYCDLTLTSV
jgi:hypothetical protein